MDGPISRIEKVVFVSSLTPAYWLNYSLTPLTETMTKDTCTKSHQAPSTKCHRPIACPSEFITAIFSPFCPKRQFSPVVATTANYGISTCHFHPPFAFIVAIAQ